ncbi:hypothetical protein [Hypericibacter terrae]|jgi:flagellar protein FliJ|nr:hypothetical protein [Hypericibacter terrae]
MSAVDQLVRLHRWRLEEERRKMGELQRLAERLNDQIRTLDESVEREAAATKEHKTLELSRAFAAFADLARMRREKLVRSQADVTFRIEQAREAVLEVYRELEKYEQALKSREERKQAEIKRRERIREDEIGMELHRRRR